MLDDNDRRAVADEGVEYLQQRFHVLRVQTDGRLVEYEYRVRLLSAHLACQLQPLRLAAG